MSNLQGEEGRLIPLQLGPLAVRLSLAGRAVLPSIPR